MPKIYPFRALRPEAGMVEQITAKSTDFPSQEDLVSELVSNPFTFHHLTKSHLSASGAFQEPEKYLPFAANYIKSMLKQGKLMKDEEASFYIYEQHTPQGRTYRGIIGLCAIEDYKKNKIKKHEEIRPSRLKFLVELFKTAKVMGEPTLLAHSGRINLEYNDSEKLYEFRSPDGKLHIVYKVTAPADIERIQNESMAIDSFYIADGHHRSASTEEFNQNVNHLANDKSMCFIIEEDQLEILPFHRLIKPTKAIAKGELIGLLSADFNVFRSEKPLYDVEEKNSFGLYIDKEWYKLQFNGTTDLLDVEILEEFVVRKIFSIQDSRTDSQINFHPHTSGLGEMKLLIDSEVYRVAFTTKPCIFGEVRKVSDMNKTLPPKSTYIEPKLRAGLIIQQFEEL